MALKINIKQTLWKKTVISTEQLTEIKWNVSYPRESFSSPSTAAEPTRLFDRTDCGSLFCHQPIKQSMCQWINQCVNESINVSMNQSMCQWINPCVNESINVSIKQSMYQWINQCINEAINVSMNPSMYQWSNQCVNEAINGSMKQSMYQWSNQCINESINVSMYQSINQWINPSIHQLLVSVEPISSWADLTIRNSTKYGEKSRQTDAKPWSLNSVMI